jgi:hypothetical protein
MLRILMAAGVALLLCGASVGARAGGSVDLALVLAVDVSRSIDDEEFKLQREGYAAALIDPRVIHAVTSGPAGAIAVAYLEWSGEEQQQFIVDWTVIRDDESAAVIADTILKAPRPFGGRTSISGAIDVARAAFQHMPVKAERRVIDVSGDGTNNAGRMVTEARDEAVAEGITINGLAIINNHPTNAWTMLHVQPPEGLPEWYRQNVIGGPACFHLVVEGFGTFADAITRKLVAEIASAEPLERRRFAAAGQ